LILSTLKLGFKMDNGRGLMEEEGVSHAGRRCHSGSAWCHGGALLRSEVGDEGGGPGPRLDRARASGLDGKVGRGGSGGFYWLCFGEGKV
jgi:hypothetical protein